MGEDSTGEILNALRFADRATKIKVQAKIIRYWNLLFALLDLFTCIDLY